MKMNQGAMFFFAGLLLGGCASVPFEPVKLSSVESLDARAVVTNFKEKLANHFSILESVVIHYRGRELTALGYSEVDEKANAAAVAGVTPLGVKLFEVKAVKDDLKYSFSLPQIKNEMDHEKIAKAVADDVRRIYLGRVPLVDATVLMLKDKVCYRQASGKGVLEFYFGGPGNSLIEKRYREGRHTVWSVRYFEYQAQASKIYPSKIFYEQRDRKYTLALRLKEILA